MKALKTFVGVVVMSAAVAAQSPEPPVADPRVAVQTLLREDIFAGFLQSDVTRLARAERNAKVLLASRPAEREGLLAWQGAMALTRAVLAKEANQMNQFRTHYARAQNLFSSAMKAAPDDFGVVAITGGAQVMLADRLPATEQKAAWELGYKAYQRLWKLQSDIFEELPVHHKGEVLSGLAQAAARTGRTNEAAVFVDRIVTLLPNTPYASRARQWKENPSSRAKTNLTCQTCHAAGTLVAQLAHPSK